MAFTSHRIALVATLALAFCAWVVALAGISTITYDCYANYAGDGIYSYKGTGLPIKLNQNCVRGLQFQWWGVWFEFIVLVFALVYTFTNTLAQHQATISGLLATVTAINMWNARLFMYKDNYPAQVLAVGGIDRRLLAADTGRSLLQASVLDPPGNVNYVYDVASRQSGLNAAAAGYVMFCTFNLILLLLIGSGFVWFGDHSSSRAGAASAGPERGPPQAFTPAAFTAPVYSPRATGDPALK